MYVERDCRKQAENTSDMEYLGRCLDLLVSTMIEAVPRLCSMCLMCIVSTSWPDDVFSVCEELLNC